MKLNNNNKKHATDSNWELDEIFLMRQDEINSPSEKEVSWQKYAKVILPHVGLILLSTLYILTGAAVFYHVEKPHEINVRSSNLKLISEQKKSFLDKIWRVTRGGGGYEKADWTIGAIWDLENITKMLFDAFDTRYVEAAHLISLNQTDSDKNHDYWTYNAAVFFSSTLLTTIGYGNLVPATFEGRVFCICYGLLGVPLVLITVTDIGKFLAEHITAVYGKYAKWKKRMKRRYAQFRRRRVQRQVDATTVSPDLSSTAPGDLQHLVVEDLQPVTTRPPNYSTPTREGVDDDDNHDDDGEGGVGVVTFGAIVDPRALPVPTVLILSILLSYMVLGAWLFSYLEQWTFFDAFYFAFISLTTIGFGDFVPENQSYYLFDMLYIVVGLSITTMCIDLVGAEYIEKIHNFGVAIKDARYALINVGGKMVQVRDLVKYSALLHRKYGLTEARIRQLERDGSYKRFPDAFTPREIKMIRYIDYVISSDNVKKLNGGESAAHGFDHGSASASVSAYSMDLLNADLRMCGLDEIAVDQSQRNRGGDQSQQSGGGANGSMALFPNKRKTMGVFL